MEGLFLILVVIPGIFYLSIFLVFMAVPKLWNSQNTLLLALRFSSLTMALYLLCCLILIIPLATIMDDPLPGLVALGIVAIICMIAAVRKYQKRIGQQLDFAQICSLVLCFIFWVVTYALPLYWLLSQINFHSQ